MNEVRRAPEAISSPEAQNQNPRESQKSVPAAARARAEWRELLEQEDLNQLQKIEQERDQKQKRQQDLIQQAAGQRTAESWTANQAETPRMLGMDVSNQAKTEISNTVDEKFNENLSIFNEVGISSAENIATVKSVAKEVIYEYFTKNGANVDEKEKVEKYVENQLIPKLTTFFESLKKIYEENKQKYSSPLEFLKGFNSYSGLNILQGDRINEPGLKTLILLEASNLQNLSSGFSEYINLNKDIERLTGEASNLLGEKVDIGKLFKQGQLKLNNAVILAMPAAFDQFDQYIKQQIEASLPANLSDTVKTRTVDWLLNQVKLTNPQPGQTVTLAENGQIKSPETVAASAETTNQQGSPESPTQPAAQTTDTAPRAQDNTPQATEQPAQEQAQKAAREIKTGNAVLDEVLKFFKTLLPAGFFDKITQWLSKLGLGESEEFSGLEKAEKKEALILKEAAKQLQLNEKTMAILYKDGVQVKKILSDKAGLINTGWNEYLNSRLSPAELELLKKDPGMDTNKAEKIAAMILSPVENS